MAGFEPKQFGKYYLLEKLAIGGMAEIYKAKTFGVDGFEKLLALKRILPHCSADKDFITMLIDEAKLSVLLSHANIVQVYDLGKVGEDYFISMEFINGPNLRDIVYRCREKNIKFPPELSVYIISEVCKGLDYAHRKTDQNSKPLNLVHRDVSPQNILISYEGEVKIVDFGIAKAAMNISHTMAGILKGKIAYMSPEQALGKPIDFRTDIFSTGIVLHEALTQEKLFTGESQFEVLKKIRSTRLDESKIPESIPQPLKAVLAKALSYYPKDRYQSAGDMQIDLTRFLYQSYIDFSPQKLAAFVKDLFLDELKRNQTQAGREAALEVQTSSINVAEEAMQENIVHREDTGITVKASASSKEAQGSDTGNVTIPDITAIRRRHFLRRSLTFFIMFFLVAGAAFSYWKWIHPSLVERPVPTNGTVSLDSSPGEAKIFLDGKDTGLLTPAIIENLQLDHQYTIKLKKDGFAEQTQTLTPTSTEPTALTFTLSKEIGTINIFSEPAGARIFINGEDTGKDTPSTITDLELNKNLNVTLKKSEFKDFEQAVALQNMEPITIQASLAKILYSNIRVSSQPPGATIFLNGVNTGQVTPATISKLEMEREYTIGLTKSDHTEFSKTIFANQEELSVAGILTEVKPKEEPKEKPQEKPIEQKTTLTVTSVPSGADIFLNGASTGRKTPSTFSDLQIKKQYSIKLTKPEYQAWSKKVYLAKAEPSSISGSLKEISKKPIEEPIQKPVETKQKPEEPIQKPEESKQKPVESKEKPQTGGFGTIRVNSKPSGADVFIGGEQRGTTPLTIKVPSGSVSVLVNKPGSAKYSTKINVGPGETKDLGTVNLGSAYGQVLVNSTPPGASVTIDGQGLGSTPVTVKKISREKSHTISISLSGYKTWSTSFEMGDQNEKKFNVTLEGN